MQSPSLLNLSNFKIGLEVAAGTLNLYLLGVAIYNRYFHPYRHFPGPFLASITDAWYFRAVRFGRSKDFQRPIHEKYGPFVRIGPNQIQISDPAAIDTIYGPGQGFTKAEFYSGFSSHIGPREGLFIQADEKEHAIRRRIVAPLYTQASFLKFEPCVDRLIALFYERMQMFADTREEIEMSTWLRKYTFDVVGEVYYGRMGGFGFIRDNIDYNGWCALMETMPPLASAITYLPKPLRPVVFMAEMIFPSTRQGAKGFFDVIKQSHLAVKQRLAERAEGKANKNDLLNRLLDLVNGDPDPKKYWTTLDVTTEIWSVIWAGSDTTAIALTSIFYHLHKSPATLAKLREEIDEAFQQGRLSYPLCFTDCIKLPYLHSVVREATRIHSSLSTGLPRTVPPGGATICGRYFPGGYDVTVNSNVVHFDKTVFGDDADDFIPERWTRDGPERAAEMERYMLTFGYGSRVCIGKHLSYIEMFKLLPTILRDFEFEGLEGREWKVVAAWFQQQRNVKVTVKRRRPMEANTIVEIPKGKWRDE